MITTNKKLIITTLIGVILLSNVVLAIPGIPNQFYGTVTYNGQPARDGLSVVAKINGVEVGSTTTFDGKYGYTPLFKVQDPYNDRSGETINFFVNGVYTGQTASFCNACITELDLTAVGVQEEEGGNSGGGGGGGGGTKSTEETTTTTTIVTQPTFQVCQEKWSCTEWSSCKNAIQTRTCTEENNCGTDLYKPFESQPCATGEAEGEASPLTGLLALIPSQAMIGLIALVLIVVIFFGWRKVFRKKTTSSMNKLFIQ